MEELTPFRVLSLDGGGMRGTYAATYLSCLAKCFAKRRGVPALDLGKAFDLIVGTSTGGIIACALAAGIDLDEVVALYRDHGRAIFPLKVPAGIGIDLIRQRWSRPVALRTGALALQEALSEKLGSTTLAEVYNARRIALAITAVEMSQHRSWVFKTPHLTTSNSRDDSYSLTQVCMATSAAPVFRSMAFVPRPNATGSNVFVDGGLWANNPVLVGLTEALEMTESDTDRPIHIFSLGTCPKPAGEQIASSQVDRGLGDWGFGGDVAALAIDAQEFAYDQMAAKLARHVNRTCEVMRFPREQVPAALMPYLELDDTRPEAMQALINQAHTDADMTNSRCHNGKTHEGDLVRSLFETAPAVAGEQT